MRIICPRNTPYDMTENHHNELRVSEGGRRERTLPWMNIISSPPQAPYQYTWYKSLHCLLVIVIVSYTFLRSFIPGMSNTASSRMQVLSRDCDRKLSDQTFFRLRRRSQRPPRYSLRSNAVYWCSPVYWLRVPANTLCGPSYRREVLSIRTTIRIVVY